MSDTKYGHLIDDNDESDGDENSSEDVKPPVEVTRHTITIDDQRDKHGYEHGLDWTFFLEDGQIKGYRRGHWLEGKTQSDPITSPAWSDVPAVIKDELRNELGIDRLGEIPVADLPDHYGGEESA